MSGKNALSITDLVKTGKAKQSNPILFYTSSVFARQPAAISINGF